MNVFVTGGSRGIGKAIVLYYVSKGWGVAFTYSSRKESADQVIQDAKEINPNVKVQAYQLNLVDAAAIETICEQVIEDFENIDAVVNNAAIVKDNAAALMSNEEWDDVIAVNLSGAFYVTRSFLLHFLSNRNGRFIHISSLSAAGSSGQINYAAAKAGLEGMSLTIAKEYGKKGITSNIVAVGYAPTDMTKESLNPTLHEYWLTYCPAKRVGKVDEVASAVHYLSTEEAGFINGEKIHVSGGLTYAP